MKQKLEILRSKALDELNKVPDSEALNALRVKYLGKKGLLTEVLRKMGNLDPKERPMMGQMSNKVRATIENLISQKQADWEEEALQKKLEDETLDVTLPGKHIEIAAVHPLNKIIREVEDIFISMGYFTAEGPEVETDFYNFEALNIPCDHPARDMQDSFYLASDLLLRSQTSPVQIRTMRKMKGKTPIKVICSGKVYRRDDDDATHSFMFHQIEGLVVGKNIRMSDLKGNLLQFVKKLYGEEVQIRMRPSFFPFTEPSVEVDVTCTQCGGKGCRMCKESGWIEILGAGMVHPKVLEYGGYRAEEVSGFAFGMGVERIALLKYGIEDIRHFFNNDIKFLSQFAQL